jgi:HAD superfamily phosphoserine phosphatase-like hydrolase
MTGTRRYDLVAFDVDGTLIDDTVFIWQTLHDYFRTDPELRDMAFREYMAGRWPYVQWFEHDLKLLTEAGADRESMLDAIRGMKLMGGALETLRALKEAGCVLAVISGSLDMVIEKFQLAPYFDVIHLNRLWFDDRGKLTGWQPTPYDVCDKATGLRDIARERGIPLSRAAFVGDNYNDVAVARAAGFSIAFNCKSEELARTASVVVPGGDLTAVLPYLLEAGVAPAG